MVFLNSKILDFDIYALTETWLHPGINSLELFDESFSVYRKDRYHNTAIINEIIPKGGGVMVAIRNIFKTSEIALSQFPELEIVAIKVELTSKYIYVICCYIPPNSTLEQYSELCQAIDYISSLSNSLDEIMLCGDFNLPDIVWSTHEEECFLIPSHIVTSSQCSLIDGLNANFLQQVSNITNYMGKQLDLFFTSDWTNFTDIHNILPLVNIDNFHPPISFSYCCNSPVDSSPVISYRYNFLKANFNALNTFFLSIDFDTLLSSPDIDEAVCKFYGILLHGFNMYIPSVRDRGFSSSPTWFNRDLRRLRNKKNRAWNNFLKFKTDDVYLEFVELFNSFKSLLDSNYNNYLNDMAVQLKTNPKLFWKFVNSKRKSDQFPNFMSFNGESTNDPLLIANLFKDFFASSYSANSFIVDESKFHHMHSCPELPLSSISYSDLQVKQYLDRLKQDASPGPDNVPEIILKNCAESLAAPLGTLFNKSLISGRFPDFWKISYIRPVHKKESKSNINNYRPIAKLSSIPKLFELMIYDSIYSLCSELLIHNQHGFMKNRSTVTNLVEVSSFYINTMEAGYQTDVIYTDLSKAFDLLPHSVICFKLKKLGFPGFLIKWISSYLENRKYCVKFRSATSDPYFANSGVPQGSHLGPFLFIFSINDVDSIIKNSKLSIYADDMKIYNKITSQTDAITLQEDLDSFKNWCDNNNLSLNIGKCASISYTRCTTPLIINYSFDNKSIIRVSHFKDLGVYFDNKMTFKHHFENIIGKANSMLGFVKRWSKEFEDPYILKSLFISLVRPNLEYASQVWCPYYQDHIKRLESVQKNFLRYSLRHLNWVNPLILPPYSNRLILLQLNTLESRRTIADILFIVQVYNGQIKSDFARNQVYSNLNHSTRFRSENIFRAIFHRTNYGKFEPINRMFMAVNNYKSHVDFSLTKEKIKKNLLLLMP